MAWMQIAHTDGSAQSFFISSAQNVLYPRQNQISQTAENCKLVWPRTTKDKSDYLAPITILGLPPLN